jgi:hypothetical protein
VVYLGGVALGAGGRIDPPFHPPQVKAFLLAAYDIKESRVAEYDPLAPAALRAPVSRPATLDPGLSAAGLALEPAPPGLEAVLLQVSRAWC